jgi:peptidoglycan/xylan/chitin deacetylase (PgdA/CDA1 family)
MPDGAPPRPLGSNVPERFALAQQIRTRCKQLPDESRAAYVARLKDVPVQVGDHDERTAFLSWDEVRELRRLGFDLGSHTHTHPILTRIGPDQLACELKQSKSIIEEQLGNTCPAIVYPNGGVSDVSPEVFAAAGNAGYQVGFTLTGDPIPLLCNPFAIPRTNITGHLPGSLFRAMISHLIQ